MAEELPDLLLKDLVPKLESRHRDAMLDLILAWGTLDGSFGMLLSRVMGLPYDEGVSQIGRKHNITKIEKTIELLADDQFFRKKLSKEITEELTEKFITMISEDLVSYKDDYKEYSEIRNIIAHSHCAGHWRLDTDCVIFLKFEKFAGGEMTAHRIPIQLMKLITKWANLVIKWADEIIDATEGL